MSVIKIKAVDQVLTITNAPMIAAGDINSDYIIFTFDSVWDNYAKTAVFYRDDNKEDVYESVLDSSSNTAIVPHEVTATDGKIWIGVVGVKTNGQVLTSEVIWYEIVDGVYTGAMASRSAEASSYKQILQVVHELKSAVGSPLVANAAADMTDTTKIYVYTGSETGYTAGNWYYYNGSAWTSGGVYNNTAVETDTTLSVPGKAADAKATGDAINSCVRPVDGLLNVADFNSIDNNIIIPCSVNNTSGTIANAPVNGWMTGLIVTFGRKAERSSGDVQIYIPEGKGAMMYRKYSISGSSNGWSVWVTGTENAVLKAQAEKNAADIDYIAMMSDVELDAGETEGSEDEQGETEGSEDEQGETEGSEDEQ